MPRLSVWFVRTALCYLAIGLLAGALLLVSRGVFLGAWVAHLRPVHIEFLLMGWTVQLALGVAFWILPRFRVGAERGPEGLAWLSYGLLNAGVVMAALGPAAGLPATVPLLGHTAEALAAAAFSVHAWPRAKVFGTDR
jgi:cbb3-type cytochrome oxidase subunit 1